MTISSAVAMDHPPAVKIVEKRRFQRVEVNLLGRFMLENKLEYPCQVINMSPGGTAMITPVIGDIGERVIAYIDHIGRVEGKITRTFSGGFAFTINATERKRDKLAAQLTWLANRHELDLAEDRRHERVSPKNPYSHITLEDGREYRCKVLDMSLSGAAVGIDVRPELGSPITLGKMRGRVVRHLEEGIAIEFAAVQAADGPAEDRS